MVSRMENKDTRLLGPKGRVGHKIENRATVRELKIESRVIKVV